jgi:alkaline phosphatase D
MKNGIFIVCTLVFALSVEAVELKRFSFGSCNNQFEAQPLWKDLIRQSPDLFIWGGDNVYVDSTDPSDIKRSYDVQNQNTDYMFFKAKTPVIGTWDDHDFGYDNATGTFAGKKLSQRYLLDFLDEPEQSKRRRQEGVYTSYVYGEGERKTKVILLDNRYFKGLDKKAPMLGQAQWSWLEAELTDSDASLHFIVAGLSILSPVLPFSDEWADYPVEYNRFLKLIRKTNPKGLVVLSGDKHFSSIFKREGILEFMSSGMTHTIHRGLWRFLSRKYPSPYFGLSYGQVDIKWKESNPTITLAIRNSYGESFQRSRYTWAGREWRGL